MSGTWPAPRSRSGRIIGLAILLAVIVLALPGCAGTTGESSEDGLLVVASTTILGDVVGTIVGDDARVEVLMPPGADPHGFTLSAAQADSLRSADLVVVNGLGFEEGLGDAISAAAQDGATVLTATDVIQPLGADPHFWHDPTRMAEVGQAVAAALSTVDSQVDWAGSSDRLAETLAEVDAEVADILSAIPDGQRRLVTNHESLAYLADRYNLEIVSTIIPGASTLAQPSASDLDQVVTAIRQAGVRAIFAEVSSPTNLAEVVAEEVGTDIQVVELFTESLSDADGPAPTYRDLLTTNATRIAEALS